jgi:hypothetical protein
MGLNSFFQLKLFQCNAKAYTYYGIKRLKTIYIILYFILTLCFFTTKIRTFTFFTCRNFFYGKFMIVSFLCRHKKRKIKLNKEHVLIARLNHENLNKFFWKHFRSITDLGCERLERAF